MSGGTTTAARQSGTRSAAAAALLVAILNLVEVLSQVRMYLDCQIAAEGLPAARTGTACCCCLPRRPRRWAQLVISATGAHSSAKVSAVPVDRRHRSWPLRRPLSRQQRATSSRAWPPCAPFSATPLTVSASSGSRPLRVLRLPSRPAARGPYLARLYRHRWSARPAQDRRRRTTRA